MADLVLQEKRSIFDECPTSGAWQAQRESLLKKTDSAGFAPRRAWSFRKGTVLSGGSDESRPRIDSGKRRKPRRG